MGWRQVQNPPEVQLFSPQTLVGQVPSPGATELMLFMRALQAPAVCKACQTNCHVP